MEILTKHLTRKTEVNELKGEGFVNKSDDFFDIALELIKIEVDLQFLSAFSSKRKRQRKLYVRCIDKKIQNYIYIYKLFIHV